MSTSMDSQDLRSPALFVRHARTFQEMGLPSKAIQPLKPGARLTRAFSEVNFMKSSDETMLLEQLNRDFFLYILEKQSMKHLFICYW